MKKRRFLMIAALLCAAVMGAWAQTVPEGLSIDTDYNSDEEGYYYVNMPRHTVPQESITISDPDLVFKVYDNGGKNGPYGTSGGTLRLQAPEGYCFEIKGTYVLEDDIFVIYNSTWADKNQELFFYQASDEYVNSDSITTRRTTSNWMFIKFFSQAAVKQAGFELTVRIKPLHVFRGEGTEESPYEIWSSEAWEYLRTKLAEDEAYASKYYKQMRDFEVTHSIGTQDRAFTGHYDGNSHSIACTMSATGEATAPFYRVSGAEITNLHVTGTISGGIHTAGLVAFSSGSTSRTSIANCRVSATITCTGNDINNAHGGGFIGHAEESEYALTGCLFDGKLIAGENNGRGDMHLGAFVGWAGSGTRIIQTSIEKGTYEGADKSRIAFCWQNDETYRPNSYGGNFYFSDLGHSDGADKLVSMESGTEGLELNFDYTWEDAYHGAMKKATSEYRFLIDGAFYTISNGDASFHLDCPAMWNVTKVMANGNEITPLSDGSYHISYITEPVTITLEHGYTYWTDEGNYATEFSSVEGSTITITSKAELARLAYLVNSGEDNGSGKTYKLDASQDGFLDMSEKAWKPIGNGLSHRFLGIFDCQGYTISGINVKEGNSQYAGLFGVVNGTVKNVKLANSSIEGKRYVGGIAGDARYDILNCHVADDVTVTAVAVDGDNDSGQNCGGVVGNLISQGSNNYGYPETDAYVRGCYSAATVKGVSHVGGIVGNLAQNTSTGHGTVHYNVSEAKVTGNDGTVAYIVGNKSGDNNSCGIMQHNFYISDSESGNSNDVRAYHVTLADELKEQGFHIASSTNENFDVSELYFYQYTLNSAKGIRQFKVGDEWYGPVVTGIPFDFIIDHEHNAATVENVKANGIAATPTSSGGYKFEVSSDAVITGDPAVTLYDNSNGDESKNNQTILGYTNGMTANVTLSGRTLYKDGDWNTICLPFNVEDLSGTPLADATLMTLDETKENGFDTTDETLYLWFKEATAIQAGVPYIVKWTKDANYEGNEVSYDISNPKFEGVTISSTEAQAVESTTTGLEKAQMVGTYSPVSVTANDKSILFLGSANTLHYADTDRQILSCRAYFSVPYLKTNAEAHVRTFVHHFGDEKATGILEVSADSNENMKDDAWYSLSGMRLNGKPTQRGLYIHQGKKVVIQ